MTADPLSGWAWVALAGFGGGLVNTLAGGGTNLTFPTLLWLGVGPIEASATSTVALWPGQTAGAWGGRSDLGGGPAGWGWLVVPCALGGLTGGLLLVQTPPLLLRFLAPWLVLGSTALLALGPALRRRRLPARLDEAGPGPAAWPTVFLVAVYGGYFGAGMGILMLACLGLLGLSRLQRANAYKNLYASAMNLAAVLYFLGAGRVVWGPLGLLTASAVLGGLAGAAVGGRIPERWLRGLVIALGLGLGVSLALG